MGSRIECDVCEQTVADEHRIMIQATALWDDFYDVCEDCWDEHFEPIVNAVAHKRPRRMTDPPVPVTPEPAPLIGGPE